MSLLNDVLRDLEDRNAKPGRLDYRPSSTTDSGRADKPQEPVARRWWHRAARTASLLLVLALMAGIAWTINDSLTNGAPASIPPTVLSAGPGDAPAPSPPNRAVQKSDAMLESESIRTLRPAETTVRVESTDASSKTSSVLLETTAGSTTGPQATNAPERAPDLGDSSAISLSNRVAEPVSLTRPSEHDSADETGAESQAFGVSSAGPDADSSTGAAGNAVAAASPGLPESPDSVVSSLEPPGLNHRLADTPPPSRSDSETEPLLQAGVSSSSRLRLSIQRSDGPTTERTPLERARRALGRGQPDQARALLRVAITNDPSASQARLLLADLLLQENRALEARSVLLDGLEQSNDTKTLVSALAHLELRLGQPEHAILTLENHAPGVSSAPDLHLLWAAALREAGRHPAALSRYRAVAEYAPDSGRAWLGVALSLESMERPDSALDAYERAVQAGDAATADFAQRRASVLKRIDKPERSGVKND